MSAIVDFIHVILVPAIEKAASSSSTCQIRKVLLCQQMSEVRTEYCRQEMELQWRPGGQGRECHVHTGRALGDGRVLVDGGALMQMAGPLCGWWMPGRLRESYVDGGDLT